MRGRVAHRIYACVRIYARVRVARAVRGASEADGGAIHPIIILPRSDFVIRKRSSSGRFAAVRHSIRISAHCTEENTYG